MLDSELQAYNDTLDAIEEAVRGLRLASCSLKLEPLMKNKSGINAIKALANRSQGALSRLHHAYTLYLEIQKDKQALAWMTESDNQESTQPRKTESK